MPRYAYERLSAQDNMFLLMERRNVQMHVAAVLIFETGALETPEGGVDIDRYKRALESVLHQIPRYRQKLRWIPFLNQPVWVDDRHFDIDNHVLHRALPRPGNLSQLRDMAAYIMSLPLDRSRPLFEMWVVEGLEGGRFAVISKTHHCMVDGTSGVDLAHILMSPSPDVELPDPVPYYPRPEPSPGELVRDEVQRALTLPLRAVRDVREFARQAEDLYGELSTRAGALANLVGWAVKSASDTPLNGPLTPFRRFDWLLTPLDRVKAVRKALDCTVNDVVLATVTGAVRDYLIRRRVDPSGIDFRVSAPVSVRRDDEHGKMGNRVSSWILRLPVEHADPGAQVAALRDATRELKESQQALGVDLIMKAAEWAPSGLMALGAQASSGPINSIVTNVPGPQFPLYCLGARLLAMYPLVPLLEHMGLGIALFSYDGQLCWGFNADVALVPDLPAFRRDIETSFERLCEAAGLEPEQEPEQEAAGGEDDATRPRVEALARVTAKSGG